jgi:tRNA-splicing ligase RtcB
MQKQFTDSMVGIVCDTDFGVIDEAPQAYKDLTTVMANQEDMVDVVHRLLPIINVKGFERGGGGGWKKAKGKRKQGQ